MSNKKAFTLIEILVVMIIIGILVALFIMNFNTMMEQGMARAAENNIMIIVNAEKSYFFNNNKYYSSPSEDLSDDLANLNTQLTLNIADSNYSYTCFGTAVQTSLNCKVWQGKGNPNSYPGGPPSPLTFTYASSPKPVLFCSGDNTNYCPPGTQPSN